MIKIIKGYVTDLRSITIDPEEVSCIQVDAGDILGKERVDKAMTLIVDRFKYINWRRGICSLVRQELEGHSATVNVLYSKEAGYRQKLREYCEKKEYDVLYVPGSAEPLCKVGEVCIPVFNTSGTMYFVIPQDEAEEVVGDCLNSYCYTLDLEAGW